MFAAVGSYRRKLQLLQPIAGALVTSPLFSARALGAAVRAANPSPAVTASAVASAAHRVRERDLGRDRGRIDPPSKKERSAGIFAAPRRAAMPAARCHQTFATDDLSHDLTCQDL
jgi:hypothetical protein